MIEVAEVTELLTEATAPAAIRLPKPPALSELVPETILQTKANRNVLAIVTEQPQSDLSSLTLPIFSSPAECGNPREVIGVGKATDLEWGKVSQLLRAVRRLTAIDKKDPESPISSESIERLFGKLLDTPTGIVDLGVYPDRAAHEYQRRLLPTHNGIAIHKDDVTTIDLSEGRKVISIPARFGSARLDTTELLEFTKDYLPAEDVPQIFHVPVLQPVIDHDQAIHRADIYVLFGGGNVALIHDADRVADSLQYGRDPVDEMIKENLGDKAKQTDPLTVVVELLRDIDRIHSHTLDLLESRLDEVSSEQRLNHGWLTGTRTIAEVGRLSVSFSNANKEVLHLRRTASSFLSTIHTPEFAERYGSSNSLGRARSCILGITDRLSKDQERIAGLQEEIDSMHHSHSACESVASQNMRRAGSLLAIWATPLMGSHYLATMAAEHGLKMHGHLALGSVAISALVTLWINRKSIFSYLS